MFIKLNKSCNSEIIRSILDNMDLSHSDNINLILDICNYEVVFGSDFDNKSFLAFHESYEVAALNAFSEGLNNQNGKIKKNS